MLEILVIDDDQECCEALEIFLGQLPDCRVSKAYSAEEGWQIFSARRIDLIFSDVNLPGISGIELTRLVKNGKHNTQVVLISGIQDIIRSINALESGALDFITKPVDIHKLKEIVDNFRLTSWQEKQDQTFCRIDLSGMPDEQCIPLTTPADQEYTCLDEAGNAETCVFLGSPAMKKILHKLEKLWSFPEIPILLEGKTGTGKEVLAKYIHFKTLGKSKPFVALNCATLGKELFASELFGYAKGAFTGASPGGHPGFFKIAATGTLFLDEITEIPLDMQSQLLRVLQEGEYYQVGGQTRQFIDTKIIFATNCELDRLVERGLFREDLYYRINVCRIELPSLAERRDEILPLALLFLHQLNTRSPGQIKAVEAGFLRRLERAPWQGNIRELKNRLIKAALFCENGILGCGDLANQDLTVCIKKRILNPASFDLPVESFSLEEYIQEIVKKALDKFNGNKSQTARYLRLTRMQLYNKYKVQ